MTTFWWKIMPCNQIVFCNPKWDESSFQTGDNAWLTFLSFLKIYKIDQFNNNKHRMLYQKYIYCIPEPYSSWLLMIKAGHSWLAGTAVSWTLVTHVKLECLWLYLGHIATTTHRCCYRCCCQFNNSTMRKTTTVLLYLSLSWVISDDTQICETPRKYKKDYSKYQVISVPSNISQPMMRYLAESNKFWKLF